jgi:hypothetical protein
MSMPTTSLEDRTIAAQSDLYRACWNHIARIITPEQQRRLEEIERNPTARPAHPRSTTYRKLGRSVQ